MAALYELEGMLRDFELDIDMETGEILNADELDALQMERDKKIEQYALWYKNLDAELEACKRERQSFEKREKRAKRSMEWIKSQLDATLSGQQFKTDKVVIKYRKSESVELDDDFISQHQTDDRFIITEYKASKSAVKEAIKNGEEVKGAQIITKNNIQIG